METDIEIFSDSPWKRTDEASWRIRKSHLWHPRVAPLNKLVEALREETSSHVPWIDPFCGGVEAKILFVFLRPGPRGAMASNFLSLANRDATARNTVEVLTGAGVGYRELTFWNAIPWSGPREEKITVAMLERGASMIGRLLSLLPNLSAIVLVGGEAQRLGEFIPHRYTGQVLKYAHPGPFVWNQHRYRDHKQGIFDTFNAAAALAHRPTGNNPSTASDAADKSPDGGAAT